MMILPLADALQNCLQNLTSRIAGVDNEQMTGRVMGMGAMMGFGLGAIKEQFKTPTSNTSNGNGNNESSNGGLQGFISRAKQVINPTMNLSPEADYNGNSNPIRDVIPKERSTVNIPTSNGENKQNISNGNKITPKSVVGSVAKGTYNATKTYLKVGANMAEGNFDTNSYKSQTNRKNNFQNTEYINKIATDKIDTQKLGDINEHKE